MNIGVGKVSDAARKVIAECGGSIEPAASPELFLVVLPEVATLRDTSSQRVDCEIIDLPSVTLRFTRAWETKDCRIETEEEAANFYERGKATGKRLAESFPGTVLPTVCLAMLGKVTADLIANQRDRDRYGDGVVAGFYEVNPAEPTGISI